MKEIIKTPLTPYEFAVNHLRVAAVMLDYLKDSNTLVIFKAVGTNTSIEHKGRVRLVLGSLLDIDKAVKELHCIKLYTDLGYSTKDAVDMWFNTLR